MFECLYVLTLLIYGHCFLIFMNKGSPFVFCFFNSNLKVHLHTNLWHLHKIIKIPVHSKKQKTEFNQCRAFLTPCPQYVFFYYCFNILNLKCELNSFLKAAKMIWTIRSFVMVDVLLLTLPLVLNQRKTGKKNLSCSYFTSQFITINFQITFLVIKYTVSLISCGLWKYYSCCFLFF